MGIVLMLILAAALVVLFFCGYFVGVLKEKYGKKNVVIFVPILISMFMFHLIIAITELAKTARWQ
ncbi:hypothetical protein RCG24_07370 [Neobacillus sp. OS1-32]|uniref:Uncharacterized protein n=1 Tax=Neobacillus paridis TaxID=2803862 RepID=A0ABS1TNE9_9BACI|nr:MULTISPECIES: hypothetical protein [Neobacillus]MBL4952807.1 hypothetical protein [Neobacillus paridis]WML31669.1 hypothetical protein RCG24_07370 [Neobacillus sp. OS1-32]